MRITSAHYIHTRACNINGFIFLTIFFRFHSAMFLLMLLHEMAFLPGPNIMPPLFYPTKRYKTHHDYGRCVCLHMWFIFWKSTYTLIYWWEKERIRKKKNHILVEAKKKTQNYRWNLFSLSESHTQLTLTCSLSFFSLNGANLFRGMCFYIYHTFHVV